MIPTLFGVTVVTFLVMQLAPGDPLQLQISASGSQGESGATREAFLHQRRQWKLDKPAVLNFRWFYDFSEDARYCAEVYGLTDQELVRVLEAMASRGSPAGFLAYLRNLGIEGFDAQLSDPQQRERLADLVKKSVQIRVEDVLGEHGVRFFSQLLDDPELRFRIGAIRCLTLCTLGDPFTYTYSAEPQARESEGVMATWRIWWDREFARYQSTPPERRVELEQRFQALVAEPSRSKIVEKMAGFNRETDPPFFAEKLLGGSSLKEKYVASIALRTLAGRPLKADVKLSDSASVVSEVAANWKAYIGSQEGRYRPSILKRCLWMFTDTQYANSLVKLATFDFGRSMVKPYDPVGPKILEAAEVSAPLMLASESFVYIFAVPFGIYCAVRRGRWQDHWISFLLFVFNSIPSVVLGMLCLTFLCYGNFLKCFPMYGLHQEGYEQFSSLGALGDYLWHATLPVLCLSLGGIASLAMFARSSMLDVVNQDFVRTAKAKGLGEARVILKHALRNAMIPVVTLFSSFIPSLLGGSVIVEVLFGIPGMGRLSFESIEAKDYNTMMALIYIEAIVVMLSILLSDMLYVLVDPRISFSQAEGNA